MSDKACGIVCAAIYVASLTGFLIWLIIVFGGGWMWVAFPFGEAYALLTALIMYEVSFKNQ